MLVVLWPDVEILAPTQFDLPPPYSASPPSLLSSVALPWGGLGVAWGRWSGASVVRPAQLAEVAAQSRPLQVVALRGWGVGWLCTAGGEAGGRGPPASPLPCPSFPLATLALVGAVWERGRGRLGLSRSSARGRAGLVPGGWLRCVGRGPRGSGDRDSFG